MKKEVYFFAFIFLVLSIRVAFALNCGTIYVGYDEHACEATAGDCENKYRWFGNAFYACSSPPIPNEHNSIQCEPFGPRCSCVPRCAGKECAPDGCGGTCDPGCTAPSTCDEIIGKCSCIPGTSQPCGAGLCTGKKTCVDGKWGECDSKGKSCDDGKFCTGVDTCDSNGVCFSPGYACGQGEDCQEALPHCFCKNTGAKLVCGTSNPACFGDKTCLPSGVWTDCTSSGKLCDDGNKCNGPDKCSSSGACSDHPSPVVCTPPKPYCNPGNGGCQSGPVLSPTSIGPSGSGGSCSGSTSGSSYFLVSLNPEFFDEGVAYNIKPSGIHFSKNLSVILNYSVADFSGDPTLYKYTDDSFENEIYNISILDEINQTIGSEGGVIELGDIKFEIQSEDLIEDVDFTLRKVNITLSNNTIAEEDLGEQILVTREEATNTLISMITSWIFEEKSVNIMERVIVLVRAFFESS